VADGLQIVTPRLLVTNVRVETRITGSTGQVLAVAEGDVFAVRALVAFSESKINDVDGVLGLVGPANQEVVRLDISVNNALFVDDLDPLDQLH